MYSGEKQNSGSFQRHKRFADDSEEHYEFESDRKTKNIDRPNFEMWNFSRQGNFKEKNKWQKWETSLEDKFVDVPKPNKPRNYTISIAVPASILEETCIKDELRTYVVGQLARAANIYSVDEIVVYDDGCWRKKYSAGTSSVSRELMEMMQMLLEYQECPQYLRKHLFKFHHYLRSVGVLNALNCPHHLRFNQWCEYREGVVLERGSKLMSFVDVGLATNVSIDQKLEPGLRVTVKLPPEAREMRKPFGTVVSPDEPRVEAGYYWGYRVRVAHSLTEVLTGSRFPDGYDLLIGTSDKGEDIKKTEYPTFSHALIVFGGVEGLEAAVEADSELEATEPLHLFDFYTNTCPLQQTRTIRTEEAVLISLCVLQDKLVPKGIMEPSKDVQNCDSNLKSQKRKKSKDPQTS
ncbi:putative methyltransferase C9orf114 isoform X2 [Homarus americanus]|nr:putative methyltransferase C9orf114 isoform X2 [Homarus americanus]